MGPEGVTKKGLAERFAEAFEKAMREEQEEFDRMPPKYAPGEGAVDVIEPDGEGHFEL